MTLVPDAPWWANSLLFVFIASVPIIMSLRSSKESRAVAVETRAVAEQVATTATEQAATTQEQLGRVLHNVENSHTVGLRDDLDRKVQQLAESLETVGIQVTVLHDDVGHLHTSVNSMHTKLQEVHVEEARNSERLSSLERGTTVAAVVSALQVDPSLDTEQGSTATLTP